MPPDERADDGYPDDGDADGDAYGDADDGHPDGDADRVYLCGPRLRKLSLPEERWQPWLQDRRLWNI